MPAWFPVFVLILLFFPLLSYHADKNLIQDAANKAFIQSVLAFGGITLVITEGLSLVKAITPLWVTAIWGILFLAALAWGWQSGLLARGIKLVGAPWKEIRLFEGAILAGLGIMMAALLVIALLAPSNNTDSLQYHMSRVMHWAQNHSLEHYATQYAAQLWNPIGAEIIILNLKMLSGDDRLAGLVQWFSMVACLIGVAALTRLLGGDRKAQLAAVIFAASIPMGILQATSTQNDYITAMWLVFLAYFVVLAVKRPLSRDEVISLALAAGLGLLTKATFYVLALPLGICYLLTRLIKSNLRTIFSQTLWVAAMVLLLNLGLWMRNINTFSSPIASPEWVQQKVGAPRGPAPILANLLKNTLLNFATPSETLNERMINGLRTAVGFLGENLEDYRLIWGWNHEDFAGNPLHILLVVISCVCLALLYKRVPQKMIGVYAITTLAMYFVLAALFSFDQFSLRFQLPVWICWAPVFGVVLSLVRPRQISSLAVILLLLSMLPWILFNRSRPLIGMKQHVEKYSIPCYLGCTNTGSILLEPPITILFSNYLPYRDAYLSVTEKVRNSGCKDIGFQVDSHDVEYLLWWLLDAPQSGIRLESVFALPGLERYLDPSHKPCAILCTQCGGKAVFHGLPVIEMHKDIQLYMGETYSPDQ